MKIKKTVIRHVEETEKVICDKCGKDITGEYFDEWYDYNTHIVVRKEYNYYDSWTEYGWELHDLCFECMKELEKLLKENGYNIERID